DRSKEVAASLLEGSVIPRFSSSAMFDKDEGRGLRRLSVKKKLSRHLAVRGRRRGNGQKQPCIVGYKARLRVLPDSGWSAYRFAGELVHTAWYG
ncbi:hypothetical protein BHE74_00045037, partial [Ensete ventricosum]